MAGVHLELMRDPSGTFPQVADPDSVRSAKVWFCKYKSLRSLAELRNLEELVIAGFPDESFEFLVRLEKLRFLSVVHMPKIFDIAPLAELMRLTSLSLSTLPSWDASRKTTTIQSLEPLRQSPSWHIWNFLVSARRTNCLFHLKNAGASKRPASHSTREPK